MQLDRFDWRTKAVSIFIIGVLMSSLFGQFAFLKPEVEASGVRSNTGPVLVDGETMVIEDTTFRQRGNITVTNGGVLIVRNASIIFLQDSGPDGDPYTHDDNHEYAFRVIDGGKIEFDNATVTTATDLSKPYLKLFFEIADSEANHSEIEDSTFQFPGTFTTTNATLTLRNSTFKGLTPPDGYPTPDDNDDAPVMIFKNSNITSIESEFLDLYENAAAEEWDAKLLVDEINDAEDNATGSEPMLYYDDEISYTVESNQTMWLDGFDLAGVQEPFFDIVLLAQYRTESGYVGTGAVNFSTEDGDINGTLGVPTATTGEAQLSCNLYDEGITTAADIATLNVTFTNNDPAGNNVSFDYVWIGVLTTSRDINLDNSTFTAIDSAIMIDFKPLEESALKNTIRLINGSVANLYNITIDTDQTPSNPFLKEPPFSFGDNENDSAVNIYRWLDVFVSDAASVPIGNATVDRYYYSNTTAISDIPPAWVLDHLGRDETDFNVTDKNGRVRLPMKTDRIDASSYPNSYTTVNYQLNASLEVGADTYYTKPLPSISFDPYPNFQTGVETKNVTLGTYLAPPGPPYYTSGTDIYIGPTQSKTYTESQILSGNLIVEGDLTISADSFFVQQSATQHFYILVRNDGQLTLDGCTLSSNYPLNLYVLDGGRFITQGSELNLGTLAGRNGATIALENTNLTGAVNLIDSTGSAIRIANATVTSPRAMLDVDLVAIDNSDLTLGKLTLDRDSGSEAIYINDTRLDIASSNAIRVAGTDPFRMINTSVDPSFQLEGATDALFINTTTLQGDMVTATLSDSANLTRAWWLAVHVVDANGFVIENATVSVFNYTQGTPQEVYPYATATTDAEGNALFVAEDTILTAENELFVGNYFVNASYLFEGVYYNHSGRSVIVSDENNQLQLQYADLVPDLTAAITNVSGMLIPDQSLTVNATVYNNGSYGVDDILVGLLVDGTEVANTTIAHIEAHDSTTVLLAWTPTANGSYNVTVIVDPLDAIAEDDETNNTAEQFITIAARPDIYASMMTIESDHPLAGEEVTIDVAVNNSGVEELEGVTVTLLDGSTEIGNQSVTVPASGGTLVPFSWTAAAPGEHQLTVTVDALDIIAESNELNNTLEGAMIVYTATGDDYIAEDDTPDIGSDFQISGNLFVNGSFAIANGTLTIDQSPAHRYKIQINSTGDLTLSDMVLQSQTGRPLDLYIEAGGTLIVERSTLDLNLIHASGATAVVIRNSTLTLANDMVLAASSVQIVNSSLDADNYEFAAAQFETDNVQLIGDSFLFDPATTIDTLTVVESEFSIASPVTNEIEVLSGSFVNSTPDLPFTFKGESEVARLNTTMVYTLAGNAVMNTSWWLSVTAVDANAHPVGGAMVDLYRYNAANEQWQRVTTQPTDADGVTVFSAQSYYETVSTSYFMGNYRINASDGAARSNVLYPVVTTGNVARTLQFGGLQPDLSLPDGVEVEVDLPVTGAPVTVNATIENDGAVAAYDVAVRFLVDGARTNTTTIAELDAGATTVVSFLWTPDAIGDYNLTVTVDVNDTIVEMDETNNTEWIIYTVNAYPDLFPTTITLSHDHPEGGRTVTVDAVVRNAGMVDLTGVYATLFDNGVEAATQSFDLDGGTETTLSFDWIAENPGEHTLNVSIDPMDMITETNEANNSITSELIVYSANGDDLITDDTTAPIESDFYLSGNLYVNDTFIVRNGTLTIDQSPANRYKIQVNASGHLVVENAAIVSDTGRPLDLYVESGGNITFESADLTLNIFHAARADTILMNDSAVESATALVLGNGTLAIANSTLDADELHFGATDVTILSSVIDADTVAVLEDASYDTMVIAETVIQSVDTSALLFDQDTVLIQNATLSQPITVGGATDVTVLDSSTGAITVNDDAEVHLEWWLAVTARDANALPIEGATVSLYRYRNATQTWVLVDDEETDATGTALFSVQSYRITAENTYFVGNYRVNATYLTEQSDLVSAVVVDANLVRNLTFAALKPDLEVSTIVVSDELPIVGPTFTVEATVLNTGEVAADTIAARLTVDGTEIESTTITILGANDSTTVAFNWTPAATGTYNLTVEVDWDDHIDESNETNNTAWVEYTIQHYPDLAVSDLSLSSDHPLGGEEVAVEVRVENHGAVDLTNVTVALYDNGVEVANMSQDIVANGDSTLSFTWTADDPGEHTLSVVVDPDNAFTETVETNNTIIAAAIVYSTTGDDLITTATTADIDDDFYLSGNLFVNDTFTISNGSFTVDQTPNNRYKIQVNGSGHLVFDSAVLVSEGGLPLDLYLEKGAELTLIDTHATLNLVHGAQADAITIDGSQLDVEGALAIGNDTITITDSTLSASTIDLGAPSITIANSTLAGDHIGILDAATLDQLLIDESTIDAANANALTLDLTTMQIRNSTLNQPLQFEGATNATIVDSATGAVTVNDSAVVAIKWWLTVTTVDANDAPVPGATVALYQYKNATASWEMVDDAATDIDGMVRFCVQSHRITAAKRLAVGNYRINATLDGNATATSPVVVTDSNLDATLQFTNLLPDLGVQSIALSPVNVTVSNEAVITVVVENAGWTSAWDFTVALLIDGEQYDQTTVSQLDSADNVTLQWTWVPNATGIRMISVVVSSTMDEVTLVNNSMAQTITVYETPDLEVVALNATAAATGITEPLFVGDTVTIAFEVENTKAAAVNGCVIVLMADGETEQSWLVDLDGMETRAFSYEWTAGSYGAHEITVHINPEATINETAFDNNMQQLDVQIFSVSSEDIVVADGHTAQIGADFIQSGNIIVRGTLEVDDSALEILQEGVADYCIWVDGGIMTLSDSSLSSDEALAVFVHDGGELLIDGTSFTVTSMSAQSTTSLTIRNDSHIIADTIDVDARTLSVTDAVIDAETITLDRSDDADTITIENLTCAPASTTGLTFTNAEITLVNATLELDIALDSSSTLNITSSSRSSGQQIAIAIADENSVARRYWWLTVTVIDANAAAVAGANVTVTKIERGLVDALYANATTGAEGWVRFATIGTVINHTGSFFIGNYKVNATIDTLVSDTRDISMRYTDKEVQLTLDALIPDLAVMSENITLSPDQPSVANPVSIEVQVDNLGSTAAREVLVEFYHDTVLIGSKRVNISAMGNAVVNMSWTPDEAMAQTVWVMVNPGEEIIESSYANNDASAAVTVVPSPDLLISALQPSSMHTFVDDTLDVTVELTNDGLCPVLDIDVELYLDGALEATTQQSFAAGETVSWIPALVFTSAGDHILEVRIDTTDRYVEANEENNTRSETIGAYSHSTSDLVVPDGEVESITTDVVLSGNVIVRGTLYINDSALDIRQSASQRYLIWIDGGELVTDNAALDSNLDLSLYLENGGRIRLEDSIAALSLFVADTGTTVEIHGTVATIDTMRLDATTITIRYSEFDSVEYALDASADADEIHLEETIIESEETATLVFEGAELNLTNCSIGQALMLDGGSSANITNTVVALSIADSGSHAREYWWLTVATVDANALSVEGASVTVWNYSTARPSVFSNDSYGVTDSDGAALFRVLSAVVDSDGTAFVGNYRVTARYYGESSSVQFVTVEEGNRATTLNFSGMAPDLEVLADDIQLSTVQPSLSQSINVSFMIRNRGAAAAENAMIELYDDDELIESWMVDLDAGTQSDEFFVQLRSGTLGQHTILVAINAERTVTEIDYTNNNATVVYSVVMNPDLRVESLSLSMPPAHVFVGDTVTVAGELVNDGQINLTTVAIVVNDGEVEAGRAEYDLDAGTTQPFSFQWTVARAGRHSIVLTVDPNGTVTESNESNNEHRTVFNAFSTDGLDIVVPAGDTKTIRTDRIVSGNILVEGTLVVRDASITMDQDQSHRYFIQVSGAGEIRFEDSTLESAEPLYCYAYDTSFVQVVRSTLELTALVGRDSASVTVESATINGQVDWQAGTGASVTIAGQSEISSTNALHLVAPSVEVDGATLTGSAITFDTDADTETVSLNDLILDTPGGTLVFDNTSLIAKNTSFAPALVLRGATTADCTNCLDMGGEQLDVTVYDTAVYRTYWWLTVTVQDGNGMAVAGATVRVYSFDEADPTDETLYRTKTTTVSGDILFELPSSVQESVREWFVGNYRIEAESSGLVNESVAVMDDENQAQVIVLRDLVPDLAIQPSQIVLSNDRPMVDNTVEVTATVVNEGNIVAEDISVVLLVDDVEVDDTVVASLSVGVSTEVAFTWTPSSTGDHLLMVRLDPADDIVELDEEDNTRQRTVEVVARPDLSIGSIAVSTDHPLENEPVTVTAEVVNTGGSDLSDIAVELVDHHEGSAITVTTLTIATLAANSTETVQYVWTAMNAGMHRLELVLDPNDDFAEGDELNNARSVLVTVFSTSGLDIVVRHNAPTMTIESNRIHTGNLIVHGHLILKDGTFQMQQQSDHRYYILVDGDGVLEIANEVLTSNAELTIYLYDNASLEVSDSQLDVQRIVMADNAMLALRSNTDLNGAISFANASAAPATRDATPQVQIVDSTVQTDDPILLDASSILIQRSTVMAGSIVLDQTDDRDTIEFDEATLSASDGAVLKFNNTVLEMTNSTLNQPLELDGNTTACGTDTLRPTGETPALTITDTRSSFTTYWWLTVHTEDPNEILIAGANVSVYNYSMRTSSWRLYTNGLTDDEGEALFRVAGSIVTRDRNWFVGNYRLVANYDFQGAMYSSEVGYCIANENVDTTLQFTTLLPDFIPVPGSLQFDPIDAPEIVVGYENRIEVTVRNVGGSDATDIMVQFYDDDEPFDQTTIETLRAGASSTASVIWTPQNAGNHTIRVVVDDTNAILENNENNNSLEYVQYVFPRVDLNPISLTFSDNDPVIGDVIDISAQIMNDGMINVSNVNIVIYDSTTLVHEERVDLDYGETVTITAENWSLDYSGEHPFRVVVDPPYINHENGDILERNEQNNEHTATLAARTKANLLINPMDISLSSDSVVRGETVYIELFIQNEGEDDARRFNVTLYDVVGEEQTQIASWNITLAAMGDRELAVNWEPAVEGRHFIRVVLDENDVIAEGNEEDNTAQRPVNVKTRADLRVDASAPKTVREGTSITIVAEVFNEGETDAELIDVVFFLAGETDVQLNVSTIDELEGADLEHGLIDSTVVSIDWTAPQIGTYTFRVQVNKYGLTNESNYQNNNDTVEVEVFTRMDVKMSDISFDTAKRTDTNYTAVHNEVTIMITVQNVGIDAIGAFRLSVTDDGTTIANFSSAENGRITDQLPLAVNNKVTFPVPWTPTTIGTHMIAAVVDSADRFGELNESNNDLADTIEVLPLPDLVLVDQSFNYSVTGEPVEMNATVEEETNMTINLTLRNDWLRPLPAVNLTIWDDNRTIVSQFVSIGVGQRLNLSFYWIVPSIGGRHNISVTLDPRNELREANETNNEFVLNITVKIKPKALIFDSFNAPSEATNGEPYIVSGEVRFDNGDPVQTLTVTVGFLGNTRQQTVSVQNGNFQIQFIPGVDEATYTNPVDRYLIFEVENEEYNLDWQPEDKIKVSIRGEEKTEGAAFPWAIIIIFIVIGIVGAAIFFIYRSREAKGAECSECGTAIDIAATKCPKCGAEFGEEVECGECHAVIPISAEVCPECGAKFGPLSVLEVGITEELPTMESELEGAEELEPIRAPSLEEEEPVEEEELGEEEEPLGYEEEPFPEEAEFECPECGEPLSADDRVCPNCGIEFEQVAEEEEFAEYGGEEFEDLEDVETFEAPPEAEEYPAEEFGEAEEYTPMEEEMVECFECGELIPLTASVCPSCGAVLEEEFIDEDMGEYEGYEDDFDEGDFEDVDVDTEYAEPEPYGEEEPEVYADEKEPEIYADEEELVECFECGALIPLSATTCPQCGAEFE